MIGATQWAIGLGQFDTMTAIITMSHFCISPRIVHLDCLKRMDGYLRQFKNVSIRARVEKPDMIPYPVFEHNWPPLLYGATQEIIPSDIPNHLARMCYLLTMQMPIFITIWYEDVQ
jgi:hypothetical protein